jgi:serine protease Do
MTKTASRIVLPLAWLVVCLAGARAENLRRTPVVDAVERVKAAVVNIHSERTAQGPAAAEMFSLAPSQHRINGMGTGVLFDPRGYIVTNQHVVEDVNVLRVRLSDGSTHTATVLARDHDADLAILKVDTTRPLPTIPLGTSRDLMVGETVIAIGNAYGYEHTVTVGIVSAVKRDVTLNKEISYKGLIQTDASINPGNSGGPLINIKGEMIGINVAIRAGAQGISFAIPVDTMMQAVAEMLASRRRGNATMGMLCRDQVGAETSNVTLSSRKKSESEDPAPLKRDLIIERVEKSGAADEAGLRPGDVVVRAGDIDIGSCLDLERALVDHAAGERVPLTVRRRGSEHKIDLVLQTPERTEASPHDVVWRKLGLRLKAVNPEIVSRASPQLHGGMAVMEVDPHGVAEKAGIQRGDILVGLHQWETLNMENVLYVLNHPDLANFNPLCFYILRSGQVRRGWLQQIE